MPWTPGRGHTVSDGAAAARQASRRRRGGGGGGEGGGGSHGTAENGTMEEEEEEEDVKRRGGGGGGRRRESGGAPSDGFGGFALRGCWRRRSGCWRKSCFLSTSCASGYRVVLCGRSLGAGVASVLTVLPRPLLLASRVWALQRRRCSLGAVRQSTGFVTSIILRLAHLGPPYRAAGCSRGWLRLTRAGTGDGSLCAD